MNIMVFNVPAESVGALSVLNDFLCEVKMREDEVKWFLVLSKPNLTESSNIQIIRFPWIKKSWGHRLFFDYVIAPKLIKKFNIDKIVSFQNITIPLTSVPQILYMHNSLPFVEHKFSFLSNKRLWLYQNVMAKKIFKSIKKAKKTIVQSNWIKEVCLKRVKVPNEKLVVIPPDIKMDIKKYFSFNKKSSTTFFYPASEYEYKNHKLVIDACIKLAEENIYDYKVVFTLKGDENQHVLQLYERVNHLNLPIKFIGRLSREEVFDYYSKSILIFPSYIETFGLPLLEAKLHNSIVFSSNCFFSKEVLLNYNNAYFFDPFNPMELMQLLKKMILNEIPYLPIEETDSQKKTTIVDVIFK
ncbi:glycosyltransferase [Paenibacillus piscarius]|uniref:glycosyltransferase n=1 Tax=Paenibacillus piscarius TaxID=1089681 RepID=UPI001EE85739|nr:glycosyltransferase [Paenibacillus piscarius]